MKTKYKIGQIVEIIEEFKKKIGYRQTEYGVASIKTHFTDFDEALKSALQKQREESERYKGKAKRENMQRGFVDGRASTLREVDEKVKWEVGRAMYKQPNGIKIRAYNAEHFDKVLQDLRNKEKA